MARDGRQMKVDGKRQQRDGKQMKVDGRQMARDGREDEKEKRKRKAKRWQKYVGEEVSSLPGAKGRDLNTSESFPYDMVNKPA